MLENPTPATPPDSTASIKRYAPPNQRNRSLNRRKSADRFDRNSNLYANDVEKNQPHTASRSTTAVDQGDVGGNNLLNENFRPGLIALEGCCRSEAYKLLNDRWTRTMHIYSDTSIDLSERPVMYPGSSASAWGNVRHSHQLMAPANSIGSSGPQMDFLEELHRAMRNANANARYDN